MIDLEKWIKDNFAGRGRAIRRAGEEPYPGEPYMSMEEAKALVRMAVAVAGTVEGVTSSQVQAFMDSMFGEYTSPGNDETWVSPNWVETKDKVRTALNAALLPPHPEGEGEAPSPERKSYDAGWEAGKKYVQLRPHEFGLVSANLLDGGKR